MIRLNDVDLKEYTTFRVSSRARELIILENEQELPDVLEKTFDRWMVLGKGSNVLFVGDYDGTIVHFKTNSYTVEAELDEEVLVSVDAGYDWDKWVLTSLYSGWYGLENLSFIPGTVGAAPIQNIGAYGVEVGPFIHKVRFFDVYSKSFKELNSHELVFSYRQSIFQQHPEWIITKVVFRLNKNFHPNLDYPSLKSFLLRRNIVKPEPMDVRNTVIEIRKNKLPDPDVLGNAGSFFKNPMVDRSKFEQLKERHPDLQGFVDDRLNQVKISAAWLIEKAGLKGYTMGRAKIHQDQPLVIVNLGEATGSEILSLGKFIQEKIFTMFQVELEPEVRIIGDLA
ncbi:MAG: UDP-N-acetylmuramate dehydrogenase [Bacteroidales bacterium]|nr:UDP-N-acetylmuramate dehydrogenase [Bacteroidales bacterium]